MRTRAHIPRMYFKAEGKMLLPRRLLATAAEAIE
jgi:hypothetical protein